MTTFAEKALVKLIDGASDPDGDPVSLRRINGIVPSSWPHSVPLNQGMVLVDQDGSVVFDDQDDPSGHPAYGQVAAIGSFSFTLWDGELESPTYTTQVQLNGVSGAPSGNADYLVGTQTEMANALAAASAGQVIRIKSTVSGATFTLANQTKNNVTVDQEPGASVFKLHLDNLKGVTFKGLYLANDNPTGASHNANGTVQVSNNTDIVLDGCVIDNTPASNDKGDRIMGIYASNSTIEVKHCIFRYVRDGMTCNHCDMWVHDNLFHNLYEDAITGFDTDWVVDDNEAYWFEGIYGKQLTLNGISGTVTAGDHVYAGSGSSLRGGRIVFVAADQSYANIQYSPWEKPNHGDTLVGPNGTLFVNQVTTGFDGIHGDFFQPLLKAGSADSTQDRKVYARGNLIYRRTPAAIGGTITTAEGQAIEAGTQGMLVQPNGSVRYFDPVDISGNLIAGGLTIGVTIDKAKNGQVLYNTCLSTPRTGANSPSRFRIKNSSNLTVLGNISDGIGPPGWIDNGTNTNMTVAGSVSVNKNQYSTHFQAIGEPNYADKSGFTPLASASTISNAGALASDGTPRPYTRYT